MILRAAFWIALVSLFMPHEPDLGFGRPGAAPPSIAGLIQAAPDVHADCSAHQDACAGGLSIIDGFQSYAVRSLDAVRADIEAHRTPLH